MISNRVVLFAFALGACTPGLLIGQSRGAFTERRDVRSADGTRTESVTRLSDVGRLLIDPSGRSPFRASPWGATLVAGEKGAEAFLQLNLSRDTLNAVSLTLASPLNSDGATDITTLSALSGTPRVALNFSKGVTKTALFSPSLEVTAGAPMLSYRETVGGAKLDRRKVNYSASANLKIQPAKLTKGFLRLGVGAEETHKTPDAQSICSQVVGQPPGTLSCEDQVVGPPASQQASFADAEVRMLLRWGFGLGLRVVTDIEEGDSRLELPVWFVLDENGKLGGGVRVGYSTVDRRTTFTVFVSQFAP